MGRAMQDLDVWLEPFLSALGHKKRRAWAPLYLRGLLGPERAQEPAADGEPAWACRGTTSCSTSSPARLGTTRRCGGCWPSRPTGWWAGRRRCW